MRPRLVTAILLMVASSAVACQLVWGYDDFKDQPDAASSGGTTSSGSRSSSAGSGGSGPSSSSSSSSSSSASSSGECSDAGDPCDCDGDGDRRNTADCDFDGGDCDDHDPLVNSKQTMWFDEPGSNGWNYNCSDAVEYQYNGPIQCPGFNWQCNGAPQLLAAPDASECGQPVAFAHCGPVGLGCGAYADGNSLILGCH